MLTHDGKLFIIDIIKERLKSKVVLKLFDKVNQIGEAKLESTYNTLVYRASVGSRFFWVPKVMTGMSPMVQPSPFKVVPRLAEFGKDAKLEFTFMPWQ